jgi:CheY-like chemotaxis protein
MDHVGCAVYTIDEFTRKRRKLYPVRAAQPQPSQTRRKVLVVDDQRLVADTVREILDSAGFDAHVAYDPWDAIEVAQRLRPDLLLSDILMPGMNGVDLAIAFRAMHPTTRIVLFSGQAGVSDILEDAERRGHSFEVLAKPIHPARLIEHLRKE